MNYWFYIGYAYRICISIARTHTWVLGTFWKSQKLIPGKKNQSVLIAKISSRKTQKIANPQKLTPLPIVPCVLSFFLLLPSLPTTQEAFAEERVQRLAKATYLLRGTKLIFADWRFFVFCKTLILCYCHANDSVTSAEAPLPIVPRVLSFFLLLPSLPTTQEAFAEERVQKSLML